MPDAPIGMWGKIRRAARDGSLWGRVADLRRRVVTFETYLAYGFEIAVGTEVIPATCPASIRFATDEDFDRFARESGPLARQAQVRARYGIHSCYLVEADGTIAHFGWIYFPADHGRHPTRFHTLRPDEIAIANVYTMPSFRGKRLWPHVITHFRRRLASDGFRYGYAYIEHDNAPSIHGAIRAGARAVGRSWRIRTFLHRDPAAGIYVQGPCRRPRATR
jgi:GNAT superfamily N-acetyltransferase